MTTAQRSLFDDYFDALVRCDPAAATDLVMELLESGASLSEIVQDVLGPAQTRVGELWERGEWSVAHEHTATAVTEVAVSALWAMTARRKLNGGPRVAVACAEGEWHALPPRMAAALAAEAGANVTVLGPSMPADHLQRRLADGDIDVLALSCTVPANLVGAARCVAAAHAVGVPVVVGGRAFAGRQQRADAIGADLLADAPERLSELPPAAGADAVVPEEALRLDEVSDATVEELLVRVVAASPSLAGQPSAHRDRTREDVRWIVRFTGAAVLTDDPTVLDDFLGSLLRILHGRVPDDVVLRGAEVVADGIEPLAPRGATMLRDAVRRAGEAV
jgi:MerR family transcriptional regulator, light-induced transcriptional regulator